MLYYLAESELSELFTPLRVFKYITVRALGGAGTAFILCLVFGQPMIRWLRRIKFGQQVRTDDVEALGISHGKKQGTPTMGGVLIITSVTLSTLLWAMPTNGFVLLALSTLIVMGIIGFTDDYLKIRKKESTGLKARQKFACQVAWATIVTAVLLSSPVTNEFARHLMVPFVKDPVINDLGVIGAWLFITIVMVGASNAVNLTDGLDGLAVGCTGSVAVAYLVMAYAAGNYVFAQYLFIPFVPGTGELAVFCGCLLGASLGFLWYNCHPAQVFMGDTGSLSLGGAIGTVAILIKQELVLIIVGGVFVIEALSVVLQVAFFKLTGGRRIFKCSPLHHHCELVEKERAEREGRELGVVETMITIRFWILGIIFALIGVATLKIR